MQVRISSQRSSSMRARARAAFVLLAFSALPLTTHAGVATAHITMPPQGTHGFPFSSSSLDLNQFGYVEQEFLISGTAQAYHSNAPLLADGRWDSQANPGAVSSYTTRILVRRPSNPSRFNGTVLVEWFNVSGGADGTPDWGFAHREMVREGYAYVGVSAQFIGVQALQAWESGPNARYQSVFHPGDSFSYDIYGQAGLAVTAPCAGCPKPLGSLTGRVRAVIAIGESQSAGRLHTYVNAIHPLHRLYQGFLLHSDLAAAPLSQSFAAQSTTLIPPPTGVPATPDQFAAPVALVRSDLPNPVHVLQSETDVQFAVGLHAQPDTSKFRLWELTGTAHGDQYLLAQTAADATKSGIDISSITNCGDPPINRGPHTYGVRAAVFSLNRWVRYGIAPPIAPRIATATPGVVTRDPTTGLALGGIRLPQIAVPIETLTGQRPAAAVSANFFCLLFGASDGWSHNPDSYDLNPALDPQLVEPNLFALYPTHRSYVRRVAEAALKSAAAGFLRPRDLLEIIIDAERADVP